MARSIVPEGLEGYVADWRMSPGLEHDGFIFMSALRARTRMASYPRTRETKLWALSKRSGRSSLRPASDLTRSSK